MTGLREVSHLIVIAALWAMLSSPSAAVDAQSKPGPDSSAPLTRIMDASGVEMILIPAGSFSMGSETGEADAKPVHLVQVSSFYMDAAEVSQKSYEGLMARNPSKVKSPDRPVAQVTWVLAAKYCNQRSAKEKLTPCYNLELMQCDFGANGYRLPTEAEWEYACRAGSSSAYSFGNEARMLGSFAWFKENSNNAPQPCGKRKPNTWGLLDMHGNVMEWCNDFYAEQSYATSSQKDPVGPGASDKRVLRGGSFKSTAEACGSAFRFYDAAEFSDICFGYDQYGFRCVRKAP